MESMKVSVIPIIPMGANSLSTGIGTSERVDRAIIVVADVANAAPPVWVRAFLIAVSSSSRS